MTTATVAEELSAFCAGLRFERLPYAVVERTKDLLLDYLGVCYRGMQAESSQAALTALIESGTPPDASDGYQLTYTHPLHGGPTLPTFACEIQQMPARFAGKPHRHNSVVIYHAFRGEGVTMIDDERYEWSKGDFFVIPAWAEHRHENPTSDDAMLFSVCDYPAMQAMGIYREETAHA